MLLFPHLKCSVSAPKRSLKILHNAHHTEAFKLVLTLTTTYRWFNNKVYKSYKFSLGSKVHQQNNRGPANMSEYYAKKGDMYDFPVYDCTQEQNGSRYFSTVVRQYTWLSLPWKIVEIQEFCYHRGVTSHFSLLIQPRSQSPQGQIWRERAQHRGQSGRSAGSLIRSSRYHDEPNSGFIQKLATIFQGLSKDHIRFSRTTY